MHACDGRTDRWTDGIAVIIRAIAYMLSHVKIV